jgi:galactose mutarotase-like enzyme
LFNQPPRTLGGAIVPNSTCAVEVAALANGIEAITLSSPTVSVTVLANKGADIYALVHRPSGVDVLWKSPLGLRAPTHGWFTADSQAAWLEMYEGGWQELFPNGGDACQYKGVELNFHGESSTLPWSYEGVKEGDDEVIVDFTVQLFRSPFRCQRRMILTAASPTLRLQETMTNLAGESMDLMWGHHPAYGAPFLSDHTRIYTNAQTILGDSKYGPPHSILLPGARAAWPQGEARAGRTVDMSHIPGPEEPRNTLAYLMDFADAPWYALVNQQLAVGVGVAWTKEVFPYCWFWQEMHGSSGFPFYKRTYTMAIEPWSSIPGYGLAHVLDTTKTHLMLAPGASLSAELTVALFAGQGDVTGVGLDGTVTWA